MIPTWERAPLWRLALWSHSIRLLCVAAFPVPLGDARSIGKRCAMRMDALGKRHTCWIGMRMATSILLAATPAFAGDAKRGEPMFQRYCSGCHGVDGRGGGKNFMPHVGALMRPGYTELLDDDYMARVITDGGEAVWQERLHAGLQDGIVAAGHCRRDRLRQNVPLALAILM